MRDDPLSPSRQPADDPALRIARLLDTVRCFAALDFSRPAPPDDEDDDLAALAVGINMLGEEVAAAWQGLEQRVAVRTAELEELTRTLRTEVAGRQEAEQALRATEVHLRQRVAELEQVNREVLASGELTKLLQVCTSREEAFLAIGDLVPRVFADSQGAVYTFAPSRDLLERVAVWGELEAPESFGLEQCWGLRRGQLHRRDGVGGLRCGHDASSTATIQRCQPLVAQGEVVGLLHLGWSDPPPCGTQGSEGGRGDHRASVSLVAAVAEQIALGLANLSLRAALQARSVRDPLTNLYNRRYLDETLARELSRTERAGGELSFMMLDIDHFKSFNDTFGHEAGDAALRQVARILQTTMRADDVVCRYGGEEFAIVMVGTDTDDAATRAQRIRQALADHPFEHHGAPLGAVTVSIGVASFPTHANAARRLVRAADQALFEAKRSGRDRVVVRDEPTRASG